MKANRLFIACVATLSLVACGGSTELTTTLSSGAEKPAVTVASTGSGTATVTVDKKLTVSGSFKDLTANASSAHIHGPVGSDGIGVIFCPLTVPSATSGTIEAGTGAGSCGDIQLTDAQQTDFKDGKMYVNIHTTNNPNGEIRGDLK
jgi:hypothetical protein